MIGFGNLDVIDLHTSRFNHSTVLNLHKVVNRDWHWIDITELLAELNELNYIMGNGVVLSIFLSYEILRNKNSGSTVEYNLFCNNLGLAMGSVCQLFEQLTLWRTITE